MFGQVGAQAALDVVFYDCAAPSSPTVKRKMSASVVPASVLLFMFIVLPGTPAISWCKFERILCEGGRVGSCLTAIVGMHSLVCNVTIARACWRWGGVRRELLLAF